VEENTNEKRISSFSKTFKEMIATNRINTKTRFLDYFERTSKYTEEEITQIISSSSLEAK